MPLSGRAGFAGSAVCAAGRERVGPRWPREPEGGARAPGRGAASRGDPRALRSGRHGGRNSAPHHVAPPVRPARGGRRGALRGLGAARLLADAGRGVPGCAVARARAGRRASRAHPGALRALSGVAAVRRRVSGADPARGGREGAGWCRAGRRGRCGARGRGAAAPGAVRAARGDAAAGDRAGSVAGGPAVPVPRRLVSLERALELAERGRGTTHPNPLVGAVVVRDGEVVGEGWHERVGGPHAEVVALEMAGARARGATLYVTMEPCTHHGRTPPCVDRVLEAGVARVVTGSSDPNPKAGGGLERLRAAGVDVELVDSFEARRQNEAWRTWIRLGRPFVTYKVAVTLDGRVAVPGARWVSGEESRRLVHELRVASDAVAVGMGTVRADAPLLPARGGGATRQPRRLAFGRGPLPEGSELELRAGRLEEELAALAGDGVQSLLLEG